ncbi:tryptophan halogenase family protein [Alteromonas sp. CI.11.F.A3]|uniref:tryptophan halogenase family protein n=1 Tax=Alteromonas sp. CI.11.F.A3 TaxID=3079555 RepID=UPI002941F79C|nr:tryptophan halogenase family protein [Alteromonas sp. CI.11.F.A3]WOI37598.1 tryptophan halogenase family protein [Alteromonas sp. CI.11.F.A3]
MSKQPIKQVVIVGGGTAGWLCAGVLAARLGHRIGNSDESAINITLVESPNIPSIGVGEGSWPSLRDTLQEIGIKEAEFLTCCHASFKQGSTFAGWRNGQQDDKYQHPFTTPTGYTELDIHRCWQHFFHNESFEQSFCLQPDICHAGLAPKQSSTPEYAYVLNYGYHFDATALATLLTNHCKTSLGVKHTQAHIAKVVAQDSGDIEALVTENGDTIKGDLFIDCSGQQGLLIDKHYHVPWLSVSSVLLNNRAVAVQVPYGSNEIEASANKIASTTIATAQTCGWTWDIGLQHRRGVGLVYASDYASEKNAESILREYVAKGIPNREIENLKFRHLQFDPGYRKQFWVNNCIGIGMSAGFIEPLEASAIAMVELGIRMLCDQFPQNRHHMSHVATRYNQRFTYRWERVIDFLKLHYALSERTEPYWLAQRHETSIPDSLNALLDLWQYQPPSRYDLIENEEIFPSASYQYVLYGMGFHTNSRLLDKNSDMVSKAFALKQRLQEGKSQLLAGLPTNRDLLTAISQRVEKEKITTNNEKKEGSRHDVIGFR